MAISLFIFIIAFAALVRSGSLLVRSLSVLAKFFGISEYATAFILMAGATSLPELFIGVSSAFFGMPELSLGNILGANVLNMTLVLGASALIGRGLWVSEPVRGEDVRMIFVLTVIPFLLALDGSFGRIDGVIMVILFIGYLLEIFEESRDMRFVHRGRTQNERGLTQKNEYEEKPLRHLAYFLCGVVLMLVSASAVVYSGSRVAQSLELSPFLFGVILLSLGSALPELVFGVRSALLRHGSLGFGNSVGSVVFNLLFILGVVAIINPVVFPDSAAVLWGLAVVSFLILFLQALIFLTGGISRRAGFGLLIAYAVFLIYQLL